MSVPTIITANSDYKNMVDLLAVFSEAHTRQSQLQAQLNEQFLDGVDSHKAEYAAIQHALGAAEAAIEELCRKHPEWFAKRKTLKTPYGEVKSVSSAKLLAASDDASIRLIRAAGLGDAFIRTRDELDREALERCTDEQLACFGIRRVATETITVKPIDVDLGKAVRDAETA